MSGTDCTALTHRSAAAWLTGTAAQRCITSDEVNAWRSAQLLLPIADACETRFGDFRPLLPRQAVAEYEADLHAAAAVEAGERRAIADVCAALQPIAGPALLLKGGALAYTVYPRPWLRARSDIDLLVAPGHLPAIAAALEPLGYAPEREMTHPLITRQRHFTRRRGFRVAIDVHESLVNPPLLRTLPQFDELVMRSQAVAAIGAGVRALSNTDALLHALVHRVAHHNSSVDVLWLYDMHLLSRQIHASDWDMFVATAERARVARVCADGLQALVDVFGTAVPTTVIERLSAVKNEPSAALLGGELNEWRLQWLNFKSLSSVKERLAFIRAHLAPPASDLPLSATPPWRRPASYFARAVHGARKWLQPISRSR